MTSLLVWLLSILGALFFLAAGYLLARTQSVSLRFDLAKYQERLGEAEKRISQMERLEDSHHHVDSREKESPDKTGRQTNHSLASIQQPSVPDIANIRNAPERLGDSLESFLEALSRNVESCQAAVLADEQGFLVAGIGQYEENLAAIAAVCSEVGDRVIDILPFGKLQEIQIVDENGLTVTVYSVPVDTQWLTLVLLSVGGNPDREAIKRFIRANVPLHHRGYAHAPTGSGAQD